ncbi:MAG: putative sugar nucleotidyl transferase [Planctomycetota bacterium]|nr:putative sugar nucleotidyl transferase [Planctomycetota bacterium]
MTRLILFDDNQSNLGPLGDLRCSFQQRTGVFTGLGRAERSFATTAELHVLDGDSTLCAEQTRRSIADPDDDSEAILVNGRLLTGGRVDAPAPGTAEVNEDGSVSIARLNGTSLSEFLRTGALADSVTTEPSTHQCFTRPWQVLDHLSERIARDIEQVDSTEGVPQHVHLVGDHPCVIESGVAIGPGTVLDTTRGPILLSRGCMVGANAVLHGPCSVGLDCVVSDHALLKVGTSLGPGCKVGGEVGNTIFQAHANKVHDGHLGDSLIGEWVNFGAGSVNSNLLNTYGDVTMRLEPDGSNERTGRQFMGCVVGDHVKFAIGTRIMTGTTIGTGSMIAAATPPPACTPRFTWLTDAGSRTYQWSKFSSVLATVLARRAMKPGDALLARLESIHGRSTT